MSSLCRSCLLALCLLLLLAAHASAQTTQEPAVPVIRTGTQLVVVDVVVTDRDGRPVHGLPRESFRVEENKTMQTVRNFDEHTAADAPKPGPPAPAMPPGTFTNYTPTPPAGTLNVLLIDALNTPRNDQTFLREQLLQYVKTLKAGETIAIFGLNSRLFLLQGFTSDPATLKRAISAKATSHSSDLLDDPNGSGIEAPQRSSEVQADNGPGLDLIVANLQQFEADTDAQRLQLRAQYTLDGLNAIGHYLENFPGRKNLIWFSGSFPVNMLPDPALANASSTLQVNEHELRETTNLLTRAQVAVYPVDARGVQVQPMFDAASSGRKYAANPTNLGKDVNKFSASQANEHGTMDDIAVNTGGHAFYGSNNLAQTVAAAIDAGSSYYTLTYAPVDRDPHGELRTIHIELAGALAGRGLQLVYRHGYYARESSSATVATAADAKSGAATIDPAAGYTRTVLSLGSPLPEDILFQASVVPAPGVSVDHLAPGNQAAAITAGPYRQFTVSYAALPGDFTFAPQPDGRRLAVVGFKVLVFDGDGTLLNSVAKNIRFDLPPDAYKRLMDAGVGMRLDVSAPMRTKSYLRIVIEDVGRTKFGAIEVPVEDVVRQAAAPGTQKR